VRLIEYVRHRGECAHPLVKSKAARKVKRHRTPLHNLRNIYNHKPKHIEKIPSYGRDPAQTGKLPFRISIADSRDSSMSISKLGKFL